MISGHHETPATAATAELASETSIEASIRSYAKDVENWALAEPSPVNPAELRSFPGLENKKEQEVTQ